MSFDPAGRMGVAVGCGVGVGTGVGVGVGAEVGVGAGVGVSVGTGVGTGTGVGVGEGDGVTVGVGMAVARSGKGSVDVGTIITGPLVGVGATVAVGTGVSAVLISGVAAGVSDGANDGMGVEPPDAGEAPPVQASTVKIATATTTANGIFPHNGLNYRFMISNMQRRTLIDKASWAALVLGLPNESPVWNTRLQRDRRATGNELGQIMSNQITMPRKLRGYPKFLSNRP